VGIERLTTCQSKYFQCGTHLSPLDSACGGSDFQFRTFAGPQQERVSRVEDRVSLSNCCNCWVLRTVAWEMHSSFHAGLVEFARKLQESKDFNCKEFEGMIAKWVPLAAHEIRQLRR
jgi:hypothetical protein